ncbi:probably inactive leucine-rich repeat receptor-like protein kinase At5g48380 [Nicotiana tabacum]|uniref:Probably inactive leucine-rich repeat receptor-like protein kinase At5g48380 n=1 Tax=Nicotiana tabacum TaxID=4097 RepID=A0A1S3YZX2_TOBAC|nr:PREDICTED: probably inactive leucine-rich repeat receptor-like protein kinase At5g48380 [Nicotiana tabacum]XP_016457745.1 PREDICTED: probably inactive leucine-rich repeat receptor-like protein kinase At5g48380 [Nicotiana tabacum]
MNGPFKKMVSNCGALTIPAATLIYLLLSCTVCCALQSDIDCLKSIRSSLEDTSNILASSWNFNNQTEGFICKFTGIECWHPDENRVLSIRLPDMGLKGEFPRGIQKCSSLTLLDLSNNKLNGSIPSNISKVIGFVVNLDLSSNLLSGEIPVNLANCSYLNVLKLDNNWLRGQIPPEIGLLGRLKTFSVANNQLTGPVPNFINATFPVESYANNQGLCGNPLPVCRGPAKKTPIGLIAGVTIGVVTVGIAAMAVGLFFYLRRVSKKKKKDDDPEGNKWAKSIKGAKAIKLSMFEKSVSKMRLSDLMKASDNFSKNNIIGSGRTGAVYRAVLDDGTSLMVKRLQNTQHSEKEFVSEMAILGNVKHRNLVPLLGFCAAKKERLLVYKDMPNGNLHDKLHLVSEGDRVLEWPLRMKIGIGAAKGFAWLHHNCNPRIIHRNISSKCILLDVEFEPRISDFGLARLMNPIDTHLSTFVNGEFGDMGYVAPEYLRTLVATPKGDVYSFGVVLLELVTGERPTYVTKAPESFKGNLVEWITHLSGESMLQDAIDRSLPGKGYDDEVFQVLKVACRCVLSAHKERPSMFEVYQLLRAIGERYNFTTENDILMLSETDDGFQLEELIVAQDVKEAL